MGTTSGTALRVLPEGVVTFLFTDIAGSTRMLHRLGDAYGAVLSRHRHLLRTSFHAHAGHEVDTQGDSFFYAFASPREAVAAALDGQRALATEDWPEDLPVRVRMGLHTGEPLLVDGHYVGMDVHRGARIAAAAHGGQVVLSGRTADFVSGDTRAVFSLRDLGQHRLKDLDRPVQILQVVAEGLPDAFPPLRTLQPPTNLPSQVGALVGRRREMQDLRERLLRDDVRLVTVTGTGGTGKTRLCASVAHSLVGDFLEGVFFVDLSTVTDPDVVASTLGRSLGVSMETDSDTDVEEALSQHIGHRPMLLFLDNFEHVLEAGVVLARLLAACPALTLLVTSRLALSVHDEHEYPLAPMQLPLGRSVDDVRRSEAVQLFVERASMARPGFELTDANADAVASICGLVDGLPLAIELAAARIKLFPPQTLLGKLDNRLGVLTGGARDLPMRQRALRTTIDWSYDLLSPPEQAFFRDLAVFRGGAEYDAIEDVIRPSGDLLELLTSLVNHSLVRQSEDDAGRVRFRMLQTLREYAAELLAQQVDHRTELRERHARRYLSLLEDEQGEGGSRPFDDARIDRDHDNIWAALDFWLDERVEHDPEAGVRALKLAVILGMHWYHHGEAVSGAAWLERAMASADAAPVEVMAPAVRMLGVLHEQQQEIDRAIDLFEHALDLYRQIGDRSGEAAALNSLGVALRAGLRPGAGDALSRAAELRQELGDGVGLTNSLNNLAVVHLDQQETDEALALFTENLRMDRERKDEWGEAVTLVNIGTAHLLGGALRDSAAALRQGLCIFVDIGDHDSIAETLESSAGLAVAHERYVPAARLAAAADALRTLHGVRAAPVERARLDRWVSTARDALDPDAFAAAWREGAAMTEDQATTYVLGEILAEQ